jgi:hypothetical protein
LSARKIKLTHTVVTAPEDTEVRVQCKDSPKLVKNIRGQWWLAMGASCRASTSSWEIVSMDKEAVEDETVVAECHKRHCASAEGIGIRAASNDAGGHWSSSDVGCRWASFLIITYVKFKTFSATSRISGDSDATVA